PLLPLTSTRSSSAPASPASTSSTVCASSARRSACSRRATAAAAAGTGFATLLTAPGMSALSQLYRLRELGQKVRVFEAGTGVGGTWYWNRYPGCRFDSESYSYGYSVSQELLDEWSWTEHFAPPTGTERYLNYVADKFDLRRHIQFKSRVKAAIFDEAGGAWEITFEDRRSYRYRHLVHA